MAGSRIPLPRYEHLPEGVYFHHRHAGDSTQLVLQVPNEDRSDSETYVVNRDDSSHQCWLEGLTNSRQLINLIAYAPHVAFCVRTGYVEELPDLDAPNPNTVRITQARVEAARSNQDGWFGARRLGRIPSVSPFRRRLMGRGRVR